MNYRVPTKAIITDAGYASRFLPITKTIPKGMLPIGNRPVTQFAVEECVAAGIDDIIIVTTPEGKPIYDDYFNNAVTPIRKQLKVQGKFKRYKEVEHVLDFPKIRIVVQDPALPYGNGAPIVSVKKFIAPDEAFIVIYSDDVVLGASDAKSLVEEFKSKPDAKAIIMAQEVEKSNVDQYGIIKLGKDNKLSVIVEKPKVNEAPSTLASYGRYLLTPEVFDHLKPSQTGKDGELWTVDAITALVKTGSVYVKETAGKWRTTGDPSNYFMANLEYVIDHEDYGKEITSFVMNKYCKL